MKSNLFRFFSTGSKKVLIQAETIAREMMTKTNSGHIVLAILETPSPLSQQLVNNFLLSLDRLHLALSFSELTKSSLGQGLTLEAKEFLKTSLKVARDKKSSSVTPEHLLLSIFQDKNFEAYKLLLGLNVDLKKFQLEVERYLDSNQKKDIDDLSATIFEPNPAMPQAQNMVTGFMPNIKEPSILKNFATNLCEKAKSGDLFPVVGREQEIDRLQRILIRKTKNNPVLVGDPGVGKTAIVEGLAQKIVAGEANQKLKNNQIWMVDLALLVAGTKYRGEFEERVKKLIKEISRRKDFILFVDEVHTLVGTGSAEGSMDTANILKPSLSRGDIRLIGATTYDEYRKYIEKDAALERRMQPVAVVEPTPSETENILLKLKNIFEKHHGVKISNDAIKSAVTLAKRYIMDRYFPDKAIDVIDEAAAAKSMVVVNKKKSQAKVGVKTAVAEKQNIVDEFDIAKIVSEWTRIPLSNIFAETKKRFLNIEKRISRYIIGQDEAVSSISKALKRSEAGVASEKRPLGSFIFLGPTGVGKTELAKVLSREVFGDEDALVKIDMSEFMEKHNISRLVGAPPGYVGYEEAGKLTEAVRQKPYSVVLLDEIEKAHPDTHNLLLQILEDGYLTDAKGRKVNFRNTIIIMTSNLGTREFLYSSPIGFEGQVKTTETSYKELEKTVKDKLVDVFSPEFLNRIDKVIIFKPLTKKEIKKIAKLQLDELAIRLRTKGIKLIFGKAVLDFVAKIGFDSQNGARPIRKTIRENIEDPVAELIIEGKLNSKKIIKLSVYKGKITLN